MDLLSGVGTVCAGMGIRPVMTCVVGSRLYGTANRRSDWDARIVYVHDNISDYFSLTEKVCTSKPQVCSTVGDAEVDVMAMEFKKFVHLLMHSSPNALEQVYSTMQLDVYTMDECAEVLKSVADAFMDPVALIYSFLGFINSCRSSVVRCSYPDRGGHAYYTRNARKKVFQMQRLYAMAKYVHDKAADGEVSFPPLEVNACMEAAGNPFKDTGLVVGNVDLKSIDSILDLLDSTCIPEAERMAAEVKTMEVARRHKPLFDMSLVEAVYLKAAQNLLEYRGDREELKAWLHSMVDRSLK